ncbi:MAG: gfo/Idh/MocA family oxidoreductase [Cyanobacteria bacterium WB6_1B_304]|jgi:predicted dehydrogenase|nr:gfo/Idh/MocA family oxidoreductase [Cyanobacteria bacterium WB6_1B_304]
MIKIGLIGCGRIGERHAHHITNTNGLQLVAVCDIVPEKASQLGKWFSAQPYIDLSELLKHETDIDLVSICTPNGLHATQSILSLQSGKHVLCEKPMAINVQDCGAMIQAAERSNKRLFIIKQNRFNPPVVAVKQLIDQGSLGKIYSVQLNCFWNRGETYYANNWKGTLELDGGTLYTQFSHFIDLLYYLIGDVKNVEAYGANFHHQGIIEFEDTGVVILKFYNGALGTIHYTVNSYQKNMEGSLTLFAEKGTIKIGGQYLNELEYQNIKGLEIRDLPHGNTPNNYGEYQGSMSNHDRVYENLVEVLVHGGQITTNMFEGLKTVEIIDKIYSKIHVK